MSLDVTSTKKRRPGGNPKIGFNESWYFHSMGDVPAYPSLEQDESVDVCIIGGGYTGLSAAIELSKKGYSVRLLEAHEVGSGASGRNGGVLGMGQRKDQEELEKWLGKDTAKKMWKIACEANSLVRDRAEEYDIDCDLRDGELIAAHKKRYEKELWAYSDYLAVEYDYHDRRNVTEREVHDIMSVETLFGGYVDSNAGHVHPLKLAKGLARAAVSHGAVVHEHSRVTGYRQRADKVEITTDKATVKASFLVVACNGYLGNFDKDIARYQMPINNFVLATEPLGEERGRQINRDNLAVVDTRFVVNYFHNSPDHRLIFGGGENYSSRFPRDLKQFVRGHMLEVYPNLDDVAIDFAWGGTLAITLKRMPHFGRKGDNVYWAQGYSGHGIAMANMGGKLVAEAIMQQSERFDLFANLKHQSFPGGALLRWPGLVAGMLYYSMLDKF